jgi:hypothetical protein
MLYKTRKQGCSSSQNKDFLAGRKDYDLGGRVFYLQGGLASLLG